MCKTAQDSGMEVPRQGARSRKHHSVAVTASSSGLPKKRGLTTGSGVCSHRLYSRPSLPTCVKACSQILLLRRLVCGYTVQPQLTASLQSRADSESASTQIPLHAARMRRSMHVDAMQLRMASSHPGQYAARHRLASLLVWRSVTLSRTQVCCAWDVYCVPRVTAAVGT